MAVRQNDTRSIVIGVREIQELAARVSRSTDDEMHALLDAIGQQQEDSARRRIGETKTAPDGSKWKPWSKEYARTRAAGKSLLRDDGPLMDTLTHVVDGKDAVEVGSNMVYAARHLYGDVAVGPIRGRGGRVPARPYLDTEPGFADPHDRAELRDIVRDFMGGLL